MQIDNKFQHRKVSILLGIPIDCLNTQQCADKALFLIKKGRSETLSNYLGTVNTDFLANTHKINFKILLPDLMHSLRNAELLTPDGMVLVWLSHILGGCLSERVAGIDLLLLIMEKCSVKGFSVYFLGSDPNTIQDAIVKLKIKFPLLKVVGTSSPKISIEDETLQSDLTILQEIHAAAPDLLLIALGNPKQEIWYNRVRDQLHVPLSMGIGGSLNFISDHVSRAPKSWQNLGFEWLYRLIQEPKKLWKRYLNDLIKITLFTLPLIAYHWWRKTITEMKKETGNFKLLFSKEKAEKQVVLLFPHMISKRQNEEMCNIFETILSNPSIKKIIFDFQNIGFINSLTLGAMFLFFREVEKKNKLLSIINVPKEIMRLLSLHRIWDEFQIYVSKESDQEEWSSNRED